MKYRLIKIHVSSGRSENLATFETHLLPSVLHRIDNFIFLVLFKSNHCIGMINKNVMNVSWLGLANNRGERNGAGIFASLDYPSSICRSKKGNICYVVESGGAKIRRVDVYTGYMSKIFGDVIEKKMDKYIGNRKSIENIETDCCIGENDSIYWASSHLHRGFKFFNSDVVSLVGNGKAGYTVSSSTSDCMVNYPSGIAINGKDVYMADSGNHCIRKLSKDSFCVVAGNPLKAGDEDGLVSLLNDPRKLKIDKNILYFLDGKKIKYMALNNKNIGTVYPSDKIIAMDVDNGNLFVLEQG